MRVIPIIRCKDMRRTVAFYTKVLTFECDDPPSSPVVDLLFDGKVVLQISTFDGPFKNAINVRVDEVDALFDTFLARGLDPSQKPDSPVHQGPLDQTWGMREFYVTDPDGNTLRFGRPIR